MINVNSIPWVRATQFALLTILACGCAPEGLYQPADSHGAAATYVEIIQPVFDGYCTFCHGAKRDDFGIDLSTYAALMKGDKNGDPVVVPYIKEQSSLYRTIKGGFMPAGLPPLSAAQVSAVGDWIDAGAPGTTVTPIATPVTRSSFFADKVLPIFGKYCLSCHGEQRQLFGINLSSYATLLTGDAYGNAIVVPGDRWASSLYRSVVGPFMPPGKDQLSVTEVTTIGQWIDGGLPGPLPYLVSQSISDATDGVPYSYVLQVTGGNGSFAFAVSGTSEPPDGLALNTDGTLTGTPINAARDAPYIFAISIEDSEGATGYGMVKMTVLSVVPTITTDVLRGGQVGEPYSEVLAATGGGTPYTWRIVAGALPSGLVLADDGTLSGTPAADAVTSTFTVQVQETVIGATQSKQLSIEVAPAGVVILTFTNDIYPMIFGSGTTCALCHTGPSGAGGFEVSSDVNATYVEVHDEATPTANGGARVIVGDALHSVFYAYLATDTGTMNGAFAAENLKTVEDWINSGAKK